MTEFLAPRNNFHGQTVFPPSAQVNLSGELTVGDPASAATLGSDVWELARPIVRVANISERTAYLAFFEETFGPASVANPCIVWRANGAIGGLLQSFDGVWWVSLSPQAGDIQMTMETNTPHGWALCAGQTLANAQTNYPALWSNADPSWRSGTSLILPDMRGRVPVGHGQGTGLTNRSVGHKGGAEKVQLAQSETPLKKLMHGCFDWRGTIRTFISKSYWKAWREVGSDISGGGHNYLLHSKPSGDDQGVTEKMITPPDTPIAPPGDVLDGVGSLGWGLWGTSATESDAATPHENMQPFVVVNYKIKL